MGVARMGGGGVTKRLRKPRMVKIIIFVSLAFSRPTISRCRPLPMRREGGQL